MSAQPERRPSSVPDTPVAFVGSTYEEAMALLEETRNFLAEDRQRGETPSARLAISYEAMRVTTRLVQIVAWLLARKAVMAGQLSPAKANSKRHALSGGPLCRDAQGEENLNLPEELRSLLAASHLLYLRVLRLDELARKTAA